MAPSSYTLLRKLLDWPPATYRWDDRAMNYRIAQAYTHARAI
jgi:hypothetical protein